MSRNVTLVLNILLGVDVPFDGEKFRRLRTREGLSVASIADYFGVARNTIYRWEAGKVEPEFDNLNQILSYFNVGLDFFSKGKKKAA